MINVYFRNTNHLIAYFQKFILKIVVRCVHILLDYIILQYIVYWKISITIHFRDESRVMPNLFKINTLNLNLRLYGT